MEISLMEFLGYYQGIILKELLRHLEIIAISIPISIIVSIPLGFYISPDPSWLSLLFILPVF